uniref:G2 and S phase-expressed protein 1 isoform X3 n=1 Tax=Tursiops truncatus TaxID=9739 RepID=A0A6J3S582_TURTR|nr:G2 and S phase-expressed protein 1 isoform X3 [Tursiops truncatus]
MEVPKKDDTLLLADEKFDFDLSLSSSSANEDDEDDEVFLGPVGHKERCIAAGLELNHQIPEEPPLPASWSPLTGEKFVEVYKEAHLLALQIQSNSKAKAAPAATPKGPGSQAVEGFIQESKLKIHLFERENEAKKSPKSLKRETYHLPDSPSRGPPLWGSQPPSGAALLAAPAQASRPQTPGPPHASCSSLPVDPGAAHPPDQAGTQKKVTSKLLLPRASSIRGKSIPSALEKPMKEKPAGPSRMKILNEKDSHSSVPPDKPCAARDIASLPAGGNHTVQGKRSLPVPNKMNKTGSTRRRDSCLNSKAKVMPTATNQFKIPECSTGEPLDGATPKSCRAQRPQSCTSVGRVAHSTPARWSSASQSLENSVRTPVSRGRRSALPTPASRRLSSLPLATPKTVPRALASPLRVSARRLSSEPQKKSAVRTAPVREGDSRAATGPSGWSPDGSFPPASAVPQALNFSPEKSDFMFSKSITTEVALDEAQPPEATTPSEALVDVKLDQLSVTLRAAATPLGDLPLIDFCKTPEASVALGSGSGPLVDLLTNTPDADRRAVAKPCHEVGQLIDLASPLILLSPEADKENVESPLLKF